MTNNTNYHYCVVIYCSIDRPIKYDEKENIISAVVDYCFDNVDQLRSFLGGRFFEEEFFNDATSSEKINKKNSHLDEIITEMNKQCNKLIKSEKLSDNDTCCYYMIFKTDDKTKIRSLSRYLKCERNDKSIEEYDSNDYDKVIKATEAMLEQKRKWQ